jgi:FKBP-type peptidyl-prolyl cis-trans isomerase FkpA
MLTLLFARRYGFALLLAFCLASACGGNTAPNAAETAAPPPETPAPAEPPITLTQIELKPGTGTTAVAGKQVTVNYTGWLYDPARPDHKGQEFDSSIGREPFTFTLGARQVIPGWDQGVEGMKIGGRRQLVIPSDLAYGPSGAGGVIPPNATLVFDVELLKVEG